MHAEDLTKLLEANAPPPTHAPIPSSVAGALGDLPRYAREFGRSKGLVRLDGTWTCWVCAGDLEPFHVSLACEGCLQKARERRVAMLLAEARRDPEDQRWEAMARNIARTLTREQAVELIRKARELPSATNPRVQALNLAFDRKFDAPSPHANWGTYADTDREAPQLEGYAEDE